MDNQLAVDASEPLLTAETASPPTTQEIVEVVAQALETTPLELPPLHGSVDSEALERMLGSSPDSRVSFSYQGLYVVAGGDGTVEVYPGSAAE